jgi:hypothetical protein
MPAPDTSLPGSLAALTAEWLTAALHEGGTLPASTVVTSFESQRLGVGEGFLGELARIRPTYDGPAEGAPLSFIAKLPSPLPSNRALGVMFTAYEREIRFYRELASLSDLPMPRCYFGGLDPASAVDRAAEALIQRLPPRLTAKILERVLQQAGKSKRRFALLIEDLDGLRIGDQVRGVTVPEAECALGTLARFHAAYWESPALNRPWLANADTGAEIAHELFRRARPILEARFGDRISSESHAILEWAEVNGPALLRRLARAPRTLNHGDFRADNIFFDSPLGEAGNVTMIDFQALTVGCPMIDVAYFIRPNMDPAVANASEEHLVATYHAALVEAGVRAYSLEQCREDYTLASLWVIHRGVILIGTLDLSNERGMEMVDRAVERAMQATPEIDLAAIRL